MPNPIYCDAANVMSCANSILVNVITVVSVIEVIDRLEKWLQVCNIKMKN